MSSAARWSYTAPATLWPLASADGWSGGQQYGGPVAFLCDYASKSITRRDARGREIAVSLVLYTERADIKQGDRVLIGASTSVDPVAAGAREVLDVARNGDTLDRATDDYEVMT
jgi:hypothetical protein